MDDIGEPTDEPIPGSWIEEQQRILSNRRILQFLVPGHKRPKTEELRLKNKPNLYRRGTKSTSCLRSSFSRSVCGCMSGNQRPNI